ncbi:MULTISPECIES: serine/threonine-protein kinase [Streptosporangium]|uniref:non-specific serine/threonine protein kinase n=1 Tax=Streptosporangium brasiliense TaxID=47480 RepID=A0ABT9R8F0_9ACTN|nr:serine/threonine-protein kinase [Streptosporangium brasiliense]MDP9865084.1 hypothetical protein [Streptosporangium brasiliense]
MPEQQTRVLADRYELIAPLGRGTMGTVWRAYDRSLGREVAIKEIRQESGLSEAQRAELRERMIREGRTAARISHPSVATVHDAIIEDGSPWIIMELVQARSLEQVIEEEGPLPPRLVAEIGVDLLGALRAAHAQGVLHRDVKPGNVLITESGRVVLTDFGIAKAEGDTNLTKTGMVIGSPGYTAPERARGEHTGPESDLWSLGATLYFAVEGRPAYERSSVAETLAALMTDRADPPTQAGPLRPVLEQLLERDHTARLTSAQAAAALRAVAETPSTSAGSAPVRPVAQVAPAVPVTPAAPVAPVRPPAPASAAPAGPAAPAAPVPAPADEEYDADRTMLVVRPKGGLRLPTGHPSPAAAGPPPAPASPQDTPAVGLPADRLPGSAPAGPGAPAPGGPGPSGPPRRGMPATGGHGPAAPGTPVAGGRGPAAPGTPVAWGPGSPVGPRPGSAPDDQPADAGWLPGHGGPVPPGPWQQPGPGTPDGPPHQPGPGVPGGHPHQAGPEEPRRGDPRYQGLGTDLFAIAGQGGKGEQTTTPPRTRVGLIVLMGVAALALVLIVILAAATLS